MASSAASRQSPFFRDLAAPIPTHCGAASRFASSGATPPPPLFTLDDLFAAADFSPASDLLPVAGSPFFRDLAAPISTHRGTASRFASSGATPPPPLFTLDDRFAAADFSPASDLLPVAGSPSPRAAGSRSPSWDRSRGKNSAPMDGVVEPHRMTASEGKVDGEEWVTVFGFSLRDTNLVLREFEKCGVILRHHSRPREGN